MPDPTAAHTPGPTDPRVHIVDRRRLERLPCPNLPTVRYLLRPSMRPGVAWLWDLSAEGVGLLLGHAAEPGATLVLQFPGPRPGATYTQLARVVHATAYQRYAWLVGCRLTPPLRNEELEVFRRILTGAAG